MPPPSVSSAESLTSRLFLGPALRTQSDRRLVTLVREGYEAAFEEIVRRYRTQLDRFAAAIVGGRSEDVTQDAFSKALLALRGSEAEIELRPWLYRIVRNTALNDLRDSPPDAAELGEALAGGRSAAEEAERRQEMTDLMERLRALPEPQRAAIVMRELEGLSHEEIAAALGVSGGAARQAIFRARQALRDGFGLLLPLPLLRLLIDHGAEAAGAGGAVAGAGAAAGATGAGGTGAALGGIGAGAALKVGVATALIAGSVGAGVAVEQRSDPGEQGSAASAAEVSRSDGLTRSGEEVAISSSGPPSSSGRDGVEGGVDEGRRSSGHGGGDRGGQDGEGEGHNRGSGGGTNGTAAFDGSEGGPGRGGPGHDETHHISGAGGHGGGSGHGERGPRSGGGNIGGDDPGHGGPGDGPRPQGSSSGNGSGGSGGSGHADGGGGSGGPSPAGNPPPEAPLPLPEGESGGSGDGVEDDS